jgi:hypothetical protein
MPCQAQLLRLRDGRHALHHISRHAVTCPLHQLRRYASDAREAARLKARLAAIKRLDEHIDPNDLSATLEAHREANRASLIRKTPNGTDSHVERPSFLQNRPPVIRVVQTYKSQKERGKDNKSAFAEFSNLVTKVSEKADDATTFQLKALERAAEAAKKEQDEEVKRRQNANYYGRWMNFLKQHEDPPAPVPKYTLEDRAAFFAVMRRCFAILGAKQRIARTLGPIETLAPRYFMLHDGFPRPLNPDLKSYPRSEAWCLRPRGKGTKYTVEEWLDTEILAFAEWMETTPSEKAAREKLSDTLIDMIQQINPVLQAETFGSQSTGLTMPNSDIDIRITDSTLEYTPYTGKPGDKAAKAAWASEHSSTRKTRMIAHLRTIQSSIAKHEDFDKVEINESAFYPLIRAVHIHTGLKIQIVSTKDTSASREAIKKYLAEYPTLKPLFLVLKAALHLRNLSDPWFGGFGSYTLFMMCVAALKHADTQQREFKKRSLSLDFLHTLHFWSEFDTTRVALSVEPFLMFQKKSIPDARAIEERKTDPVCLFHLLPFPFDHTPTNNPTTVPSSPPPHSPTPSLQTLHAPPPRPRRPLQRPRPFSPRDQRPPSHFCKTLPRFDVGDAGSDEDTGS